MTSETYGLARSIFLRGLAIIYFIAFVSLIPQITGLIGAHGIQPVSSYLESIRNQTGIERYWEAPTLMWLGSSDTFLKIICWTGAGLAGLVVVGIAPLPGLFGLWLLYLSIVTVGQDFLSFQWDALLLETGFAALLLAPRGIHPRYDSEPSIPGRWVIRFLLFRLMLESGLVKLLSGDPSWRNLTALTYHFETQPLPTPLAWYAQHLPTWLLTCLTVGVFVIEIAVPFLFLMPRRFRLIGAWLTIVFQLCIAATGNYTFFNLLTILLCLTLFDDRHLRKFIPARFRHPDPPSTPAQTFRAVSYGVAALLIILGLFQLGAMVVQADSLPAPVAWLDQKAEMFRIVNRYGLFAIMTTSRPEIIVEGSDDGEHWSEYQFKFKVGDLNQRPRWVAPYQPRLDWQMWFASLSGYRDTPWFSEFMLRLLQGSPEVLGLLKSNPFPIHPPKYVRAELYDYHFSDSAVRRATGAWWVREYAGEYLPPVSIRPDR